MKHTTTTKAKAPPKPKAKTMKHKANPHSPTEVIAEKLGLPTEMPTAHRSAPTVTTDSTAPTPKPPRLSEYQFGWIVMATNAAGAKHVPPYTFVSTEIANGGLDIVIRAEHATGVRGGAQPIGARDLTDEARFHDLVARTIADAEAHL